MSDSSVDLQESTLKDVHNLVKHYITLKTHALVKDPFNVQDRPVDFNVTKQKIFVVFQAHLIKERNKNPQTLRNYQLCNF